MGIVKDTVKAIAIFICFWLTIWAFAYTACVAEYKSSMCGEDLTSKIVFAAIKK
jgi:hypothetical protein